MKRVIFYEYGWMDLGCGCCSETYSEYSVYEDGNMTTILPIACGLCENEVDLRKELAHLEPFDVDSDSQLF